MARLIGKEIIDELEVNAALKAIIFVGVKSRTYEPNRNHKGD